LGASMRIGAEIPRYNREKLAGRLGLRLTFLDTSIPFVPDDLSEAVEHAIVGLLADALACLKLPVSCSDIVGLAMWERGRSAHSGLDNVQWVPEVGESDLRTEERFNCSSHHQDLSERKRLG
jgi:hypothetical protein